MKRIITYLLLTLTISLTVLGQSQPSQEKDKNVPETTVNKTEVNPNDQILKYQEFLREETKLHREYTQDYYAMILKLLGAIGLVVGAVLTWLNWNSKEDIKKQVNQQFKETVQGLLDEKLKQIDNLVTENKEKSTKQFEEINKIILELSAKSGKINGQTTQDYKEEEKTDVNNLKGKRILWVDDYPENNDYPRNILEQAGIKFDLALDTESAVEVMKIKKFDLIISDMGRGNNASAGLDLLKKLKSMKIQTPVIIYASSQALDMYGQEALKLGAIAITTGVTRVLNIVQKILLVK